MRNTAPVTHSPPTLFPPNRSPIYGEAHLFSQPASRLVTGNPSLHGQCPRAILVSDVDRPGERAAQGAGGVGIIVQVIGVRGSPPGERGAGKEDDFAGAIDASDAAHLGTLAVGAGERGRSGAWGRRGGKAQGRGGQSGSGLAYAPVATVIAEQAVVADFGEAPGEQTQAQTADELEAGQGQGFEAVGIGVILVSDTAGTAIPSSPVVRSDTGPHGATP